MCCTLFIMDHAAAPTLDERRTKAAFDLFKELKCVHSGDDDTTLSIIDVVLLDEEKMMARALDCLAAVCEAQRMRVALNKPLKLRKDGAALTSKQQAVRNKVFRAALNVMANGLTHDGAYEGYMDFSMLHPLCAFPDSGKLADGRGWLPMHWAVVADDDGESIATEADVMCVYELDPMALRRHHIVNVTDAEAKDDVSGSVVVCLLML